MDFFKHIDDTPYPRMGNPYAQYTQVFDYHTWSVGVKIHLYNVAWNDKNIVDFEREEKRDLWLAENASKTYTFDSAMHLQPNNTIKLPLPFEVLSNFNYLTVDFPYEPIQPNTKDRIYKYCYFIEDVKQLAPSTTELQLKMDSWQTFGYRIHFEYVQLERSHALIANSNVNKYLNNPIENNSYLLYPDVKYGEDAAIVTKSNFYPFGNGKKLILFATNLDSTMFISIANNAASEWYDNSDISYEDIETRWGHQYKVNGFNLHLGDMDYSNLNTPSNAFSSDYMPTGLHVFALYAENANSFFEQVKKYTPQVMQTIHAMWVVGDDMCEVAESFTIFNTVIYKPHFINEMTEKIVLNKKDFAYDTKYSELAKLYTFPYACLSLSDNAGKTCIVRIENCGNLEIHKRVSAVYPYLKAQAFLTGVNGDGFNTYEWKNINTNDIRKIYNTPFSEFMIEFDIPVYALWIDGATDYAFKHQRDMKAEQLKALNTYHVATRNNNTSYENTKDSAYTAKENSLLSADTTKENSLLSADTTKENSLLSAETTKENALLSADSNKQNTINSANTVATNTNASIDTTYKNAMASANTAKQNADASAYAAEQNAFASNNTAKSNADASADTSVTNMHNANDTSTQNMTSRTTNNKIVTQLGVTNYRDNSSENNFLSGKNLAADIAFMQYKFAVDESAAAVSSAGSAISAFATGNIGGGIGALVNGAVGIAKDAAIQGATISLNTSKQVNSVNFAGKISNYAEHLMTQTTEHNNTLDQSTTEKTNALNEKNTNNIANTTKNNASRSQSTGNNNASRSYNTSIANNSRAFNLASNNAQQTQNTAKDNNTRTVRAAIFNAERAYNTSVTNTNKTYATSVTNTNKTYATSVTNTNKTYNTSVTNTNKTYTTTINNATESWQATTFANKTALEQQKDIVKLGFEQHKTDAPIKIGENSGNATQDIFNYRGVQVRVITQNPSSIIMTGDYFLRYGYAYSGNWNVTKLQVMKHFTYWKMTELWLNCDTTVNEFYKNEIKTIFENGVTVWSVPNEIGKISIYDNIKENHGN